VNGGGGPGESEPAYGRVAVFGGVYANHQALHRVLEDARERGAEAIYCLGDLGGFGPNPDRSIDLLRDAGIPVVRGNYDDSIARGLEDCQCGYTDPRDNHYARISYAYTLEKTSPSHRRWMDRLPPALHFRVGDTRALAFHGSPRRMNEFLWESTTPNHLLERFARENRVELLLGTHTGLHWSRAFGDGGRYVNVGAIGRPANDGRTEIWYALLEARDGKLVHEFIPVAYDHAALASEMEEEGLPREFVETIRTGWWTTCLEILPGKERVRGRW